MEICVLEVFENQEEKERKAHFFLADIGRRQDMEIWSEEANGQRVDGLELESLNPLWFPSGRHRVKDRG